MVSFHFTSALVAASIFAMASADTPTKTIKDPITTPTVTKAASAMTSIGCFQTGLPLENHGPYKFQSPGNCQLVCLQLNKNVMGLSDGENCWCGDEIPAKDWQVKNETCSTTCAGDDTTGCGGKDLLWVVLTGNTRNQVDYFQPSSSSSSMPAKTSSSAETSTVAASATASPSSSPKPDDQPNTVAIAVGVVVGILALSAILFGVWFLLRRKRQQQAEEDYRRNAANVNAFVGGGKQLHTSNSSMNDSRLDPSFIDRRQSNGSIADNEDYSRRILKVTNV